MDDQHASIKVSIVEDDPDIRSGLELIISGTPGFEVVATYSDCESALRDIPQQIPEVALMDVELPGMSGVEGVKRLKQTLPNLDIIMLTVREDDETVFNSLCAGACGYLVKTTPPARLLDAIREVYNGGAPMSAKIARMVIHSFRRPVETPLTERETEILSQLCQGKSYKMIAAALFISQGTVHSHLKHIYKKLQVNSKSEAVAKALQDRLV